jgi:ABC-type phosphate/phosphonate transport system substrate-binding protein
VLLPLWLAAMAGAQTAPAPLRLAVTDPLARQNACSCVAGHGQRDYHALARHLERRLRRPVSVTVAPMSAAVLSGGDREVPDLIIGSRSQVEAACAEASRRPTLLAQLSGPDGATGQAGLFVVRQADAARCLLDLKGRRILLGPPAVAERHEAALAALRTLGLSPAEPLPTVETDGGAVGEVLRGDAHAAVISAHALPLLVGCDALRREELRVVGRTEPVPFMTIGAVCTQVADTQ